MSETPTLYQVVLDRLNEAREKIDRLDLNPELRVALVNRVARLEAGARHDLTVTSRLVDQLLDDLAANGSVRPDR